MDINKNIIILPCVVGDKYYTIERVTMTEKEIRSNAWSGNPVVLEHTKIVGKEIKENVWSHFYDIVREMEHENIGKSIFLTRTAAEEAFDDYWEAWWH